MSETRVYSHHYLNVTLEFLNQISSQPFDESFQMLKAARRETSLNTPRDALLHHQISMASN